MLSEYGQNLSTRNISSKSTLPGPRVWNYDLNISAPVFKSRLKTFLSVSVNIPWP